MNVSEQLIRLVNNIFPQTCEGCHNKLSHDNLLCTDCMYNLPISDHHLIDENKFTDHFLGRVSIEKGAAYLNFRKEGAVQELLHNLKYGGKFFIGEMLGRMSAEHITKENYLDDIDLIIPVPLHKTKKSIRGYNQCEAFAKGLSTFTNIPYRIDVLLKIKNTSSQTSKTRIQRINNVAESFFVSDRIDLNQSHILLVDDVVTTGATLESCALSLKKKFPGLKISMYTIAIANS